MGVETRSGTLVGVAPCDTPCRLRLPLGEYVITLRHPELGEKRVATVVERGGGDVRADFAFDVESGVDQLLLSSP